MSHKQEEEAASCRRNNFNSSKSPESQSFLLALIQQVHAHTHTHVRFQVVVDIDPVTRRERKRVESGVCNKATILRKKERASSTAGPRISSASFHLVLYT